MSHSTRRPVDFVTEATLIDVAGEEAVCEREQTLAEWVGKLPPGHRARKEYQEMLDDKTPERMRPRPAIPSSHPAMTQLEQMKAAFIRVLNSYARIGGWHGECDEFLARYGPKETVEDLHSQREEILRAFIARHGCQPEDCLQVEQHTETGVRWSVIKRSDLAATRESLEAKMSYVKPAWATPNDNAIYLQAINDALTTLIKVLAMEGANAQYAREETGEYGAGCFASIVKWCDQVKKGKQGDPDPHDG